MPTSFYDVVVLGTRVEPLLCSALLARRGLRVLVLGQGVLRPSYRLGEVDVPSDDFAVMGIQSPAVERVLQELAIRQAVRQHMPLERPPLQLLLEGHRLELFDDERWATELAREMPGIQRHGLDVRRRLEEVASEVDAVVGQAPSWPAENLIDRQRFAFATQAIRFDRHGRGWSSWNQLPEGHALRRVLERALPLVSGLLPSQHSDLTRARLHSQLQGDISEISGGWPWLQSMLSDCIRAAGGDVRPDDRAESLRPQRRGGHLVRLAGTEEEIGCSQVVHGTSVGELRQLVGDRSGLTSLFERVGEPRIRAYRCTVHALIHARAVPASLRPIALLDLRRGDPCFLLRARRVKDEQVLVSLTRLIEDHRIATASSPLGFVRQDALDALSEVIPFLDEHLVWIDSPHDGLPPRARGRGRRIQSSDPWHRGPYTMQAVYEYPTRRTLGVCALPTRTPVKGVYLCNEQVAPGLGFEGSFLAAASAARAIRSLYRSRQWVRRGPWGARTA